MIMNTKTKDKYLLSTLLILTIAFSIFFSETVYKVFRIYFAGTETNAVIADFDISQSRGRVYIVPRFILRLNNETLTDGEILNDKQIAIYVSQSQQSFARSIFEVEPNKYKYGEVVKVKYITEDESNIMILKESYQLSLYIAFPIGLLIIIIILLIKLKRLESKKGGI
jgi:myo-inositol-hexaphosphate 3-phosphohydrolase